MQSTIDDFFIPDNEVRLPEELDYSRAVEYIRSAEAFSRSTYQSVYIIDYLKRNIRYVNMILHNLKAAFSNFVKFKLQTLISVLCYAVGIVTL